MISLTHISAIAGILLITIHTTTPAKTNARPVYEVINEQARIDEKVRTASSPGILPYGNPLAGNSKQNARLHFNNQQAMFHAERMRQLTAQLQRQAKASKVVDSYMQAYHESQDKHQQALEQQQSNIRDTKQTTQARQSAPVHRATQRTTQPAYGSKIQRNEPTNKVLPIQRTEPMRTKSDAMKDVRYRSHRSYGSVNYHQYLEPKKYKTVYVTAGPTYDQGVTIRPNGNPGLPQDVREQNHLLTEAVRTKYVYPKQFQQMQNYKSVQEIEALNSLLTKNPQEQLTEFKSLINTAKDMEDVPIDLYFYLKDPSQALPQHYDQRYAQLANAYSGGYKTEVVKDFTPITEDVDDIEDPDAKKPKAYTPFPPSSTPVPVTVTPTKEDIININNYNLEEANKNAYTYESTDDSENKSEDKPSYQALHYYVPYYEKEKDESEKYLHSNGQHEGVQHLSEDGTGVSAYGDDNLHYAANYDFGYRVHDYETGNFFGHSEAKKGDNTNGHYHVLLPDGRMQKVNYHAGPEGYHADISYDNIH